MAAIVTGSKIVKNDLAPHLRATVLTAIMATAVENLTVAQVNQLCDALSRIPKGATPASTVGSLLV
jgi:hypothetical protein